MPLVLATHASWPARVDILIFATVLKFAATMSSYATINVRVCLCDQQLLCVSTRPPVASWSHSHPRKPGCTFGRRGCTCAHARFCHGAGIMHTRADADLTLSAASSIFCSATTACVDGASVDEMARAPPSRMHMRTAVCSCTHRARANRGRAYKLNLVSGSAL